MRSQPNEIEKAIKELYERETEFAKACVDLPIKKHDYKQKYAISIRKAVGTVQERESDATLECDKEYLAYIQAEARVEIAKQKLYDCRAVMEARRSLLANERSEREFANSGMQT